MFNRRALYHLYRPSALSFFRITDYINPKRWFNLFQGPNFTNTRPPAPSLLNSPIKGGPRDPQDDPPPTIHLADLFAGNGLGSPQRPPTPAPEYPRNAPPNVEKANAPAQDPLPVPPRRKGRYRPKHLSFTNGAIRPVFVPPRRRAQQLKEKRETARKRILDRHERSVVSVCEWLDRLQREVEALMEPEHMDEQDKIFLKQLWELQFDQVLKHDLDEEAWEEQKRKMEAFVRANEERMETRRRMEEAALRADEKRQHAHEAQEHKIREELEHLFLRLQPLVLTQKLAHKVKEGECRRREELEHRIQKERECQLREESKRQLQEEGERQLREESECQVWEESERQVWEERVRRLWEETECQLQEREHQLREMERMLREEAHERFLCKQRERLAREEREHQARFLAEQTRQAALEEEARQHFVLYEYKWNELRTSNSIPPIDVREMPWPVFGVVSSADQITYQDVRTFLFHPQRPGVEGKTARDKVKSEMLRFRPDKFNVRIIPKIQPSHQALAQEIAGVVARILMGIMTEEEE